MKIRRLPEISLARSIAGHRFRYLKRLALSLESWTDILGWLCNNRTILVEIVEKAKAKKEFKMANFADADYAQMANTIVSSIKKAYAMIQRRFHIPAAQSIQDRYFYGR